MGAIQDWVFNQLLGALKTETGRYIVAGVLLVGFSIHVAWVCGWLLIFGITAPFVKADDLKSLKDQQMQVAQAVQNVASVVADNNKAQAEGITALRKEQLERDLLHAMQQKCHATNKEMTKLYAQRVQDIITRYEQLMHTDPRVPTCDQV